MTRPRSAVGGAPSMGQRLGPYRLVGVLGEGQMGVVFQAVREPDGETVALKVLRGEFAADELYRKRFQREARIASELANKHIVPVVDFGEASGRLYIAAHYVRGESLAERIRSEGVLPLRDVLRLASELSKALSALHERGLVHRDVKPANVMLDKRGAAALTDFGLARGEADTVLTKAGTVVGTVDYLAPELIGGVSATPATDIYALGCLLYESLAGTPPFAGKSFVRTLVAHVKKEPPALSMRRPDVPESVCWALTKALAKDPARRPATVKSYARTLRASAKSA